MNEPDTDFNPFRAPEATAGHTDNNFVLPADQDFLLWNNVILCRDVADLPRACIANGDSEGLKPRILRVGTLRAWWATSLILGATALAALITIVLNSASITIRNTAAPVIATGTLVFVAQLCCAWLLGQHKIRITYYVGSACRKPERRKRIAVLVLCLAAATLLGLLATRNQRA